MSRTRVDPLSQDMTPEQLEATSGGNLIAWLDSLVKTRKETQAEVRAFEAEIAERINEPGVQAALQEWYSRGNGFWDPSNIPTEGN